MGFLPMEGTTGFHRQIFFQRFMGIRLSQRGNMKKNGGEFYSPVHTGFGRMGIVWLNRGNGPRVIQVFLAGRGKPAETAGRLAYPGIRPSSSPEIGEIADRMRRFLSGEDVHFDLSRVALESCGEFQREVLLAEYAIPRGWVSTYGRIAARIGCPGGARAVGRALAENPFPILIPCHRAVRSDGGVGGYQGGSTMKRALLAMEGVEFRDEERVAMGKVYY